MIVLSEKIQKFYRSSRTIVNQQSAVERAATYRKHREV